MMETTSAAQSQPMSPSGENKVLRQFDEPEEAGWGKAIMSALIIVVIIAAGVGTGYRLSKRTAASGPGKKSTGTAPQEMGVDDAEQFPDKAKGRVEINDFSDVDEGSHRLLRSGGESQTAYLTSSVVDLSLYEGECVELRGQTFASQKAGWLLDVGWVRILDKCPEGL